MWTKHQNVFKSILNIDLLFQITCINSLYVQNIHTAVFCAVAWIKSLTLCLIILNRSVTLYKGLIKRDMPVFTVVCRPTVCVICHNFLPINKVSIVSNPGINFLFKNSFILCGAWTWSTGRGVVENHWKCWRWKYKLSFCMFLPYTY